MFPASDLGILADDLTGACDAAAAFAPRVGPVRVILDPRRGGPTAAETDLVVLNTQSRLLSPRASRRRVEKVARSLRGRPVIYKKTDSVLRGPAGAELQAMARLFPRHAIFVIPAIPEMGKTTRDGRLFERGIPAQQTEYGTDPVSPLHTNDIRQIIAASGRVAFEAPDTETSEDIARAVERALAGGTAILAGSVGLADALARCVQPRAWTVSAGSTRRRTLILSGSRYRTARAQLCLAAAAFGEEVLEVSQGRNELDTLRRCRGKSVVFLQVDTGEQRTRRETRRRLSWSFRQIRRIIRSYGPDAVGFVGGETAYLILRLLRTTQLEVEGREQPGLPYGIIRDGELCGCAFATKGGSVGTPDACVRMVACMAQRGRDAT
jgi:D-threonate/D-erythronate kinase